MFENYTRHADIQAIKTANVTDMIPVHTIGSNQIGMREFNERVILWAIRLHGSTPKADLARLTNLSTQTVSVIINRLLAEGLVCKLDSVRGKIGQPSQPIALHSDGAFSIGIQIGRRRLKVMLMDFSGQARYQTMMSYATPDVEQVFSEIAYQLSEIATLLGPEKVARLSGIGVSAPLVFGGWQQLLGMSEKDAAAWSSINMGERLKTITTLPIEFAKDTVAACVAELVAGRGRSVKNYIYVFIDTLIGGGLVINSQPHAGVFGNAGAIGSLPLSVAGISNGAGKPQQLLDVGSLITLEKLYARAGLDETAIVDGRALQAPWLVLTEQWIAEAADAIAYAIVSSSSMLDLEAVIIDGAFDRSFLARLNQAISQSLEHYNWQGVMRPAIYEGQVGSDAKVRGAAYLPLHAHFSPMHDLFLKGGKS